MNRFVITAAAVSFVYMLSTDCVLAQTARSQASRSFTAAEVDALQRGLKAEIDSLKKSRAGQFDPSAEETAILAGAKASGLDAKRYQQVHDVILDVLRTLDIQGKIEGPVSVDLNRVSPEQRKKLERDSFLDLSAASATALRAKLNQFAPLWVEYINLTAAAG
jgi:hypothetical protein